MPVLRVNVAGSAIVPGDLRKWKTELANALSELPQKAPIIILLHGYKFSPFHRKNDPHNHIYSLTPPRRCWKALSWPRHLGFGRGRQNEGLCIAFG